MVHERILSALSGAGFGTKQAMNYLLASVMRSVTRFAWLLVVVNALGCASTAHATSASPKLPPEAGSLDPEAAARSAAGTEKREISFASGELTLRGVVYVPKGSGPFPAILWNHGSWGDPMVAFDNLGPFFTERGWLFFGPFRRGQGLSSSAGPYIGDELDRAGKSGGKKAEAAKAVSLLTGGHLDDQLAAYAWLEQQPYVAAGRIAVGGNSFGGIEAVLGAERVAYCAAIDAAGAAQSWAHSPELREVMIRSARASRAPMFLLQAENDFDLSPTRTLATEMQRAGKSVEAKIYPPFGEEQMWGHNFTWLGGRVWGPDGMAFLERHCGGASHP